MYRSVYKSLGLLAMLSPLFLAIAPSRAQWLTPPSTVPTAAQFCPIERSTYSAIANPSYQLVFSPSKTKRLPLDASVVLQHPKRGKIATYDMGTGNGYGVTYLERQGSTDASDPGLTIVFFDRNLRKTSMRHPQNPPAYAFVSGLGVSDYYSGQPGSRETPLGDVMWRLDRCR